MTRTTTKVTISVPTKVLEDAERLLARGGEGRSTTISRVIQEAVRAAREAEIDALYDRALAAHPVTEEEQQQLTARSIAAYRSVHGPGR